VKIRPQFFPIPPLDNQRGVLLSGVGPCEVAGVDLVGLAVWKALMEVVTVHREHTGIVIASDDLHRRPEPAGL
jgi:hypothetical protein